MIEAETAARRFQDEWLVRSVVGPLGVRAADVERLRASGQSVLAEGLLKEGLISKDSLAKALSESYGVRYVEPRREDVEKLAANLVPEALCRRRRLLPLRLRADRLEVAMANPLDLEALEDVQGLTGRQPTPLYCPDAILSGLIDAVHDPDGAVFDLLRRVESEESVEIVAEPEAPRVVEDVRAPVIRLVNSLIVNAVRRGASDVHIEHAESASVVRYRIDGVLRPILNLPQRLAAGAVVTRLKIMAGLDIADRLRPQDGRAALRVGGRDIGLRVSTLPTQYGEKAVVRLLDRRAAEVPLDALGFLPEQVGRLRELARSPQGLIVVTGPTGSGKTTTLYSLLNLVRSDNVNVVTIEDPVEYRLEKINQVQIAEKQGLGFAEVLRSVLRQDPDVIMVGEIRDAETAKIAVQAAMTGHLVLTTLHANDSLAAVSRLKDMGVEPYKLGPALLAVTAQRLVRRLCPECRRKNAATPYFAAAGCEACGFSGRKGRLSLIELLAPDAELKAGIAAGAGEDALRRDAVARGLLHELGADILRHLTLGDVALDEVRPYFDHESPARRPETDGRPRVVVAEDDATTRLLLVAALEKDGCRVLQAPDGRGALAAAAGGAELILTDLHMPVMGGRELVSRLQENPATAGVPIIVLTADTDERSQQEALDAGADDYVAKPFKTPLLLSRVRAALRRSGAVVPAAPAAA
ncbi:MAG: Flp pilus assembly complex ATPase component TadA [Elusimicrobia bacterium]|nr:Flp pilus assembly complex ATPase component TadA [Elusimicrobiota bacterium]